MAVLPAGPAAADHVPAPGNPAVGSGTVAGTELVEDQALINSCFNVTKQIFAWQGQGTYVGKTAGGQDVVYKAELGAGEALHQGPLEFTVDATGPYYHGPSGTHGMTDNNCTSATVGSPITGVAFSVFAQGHVYKLDGGGAQVPCTGTGSFVRESADWHAQWALDAACTVVGNAAGTPGTGLAPAQTVHAHEGVHEPCFNTCFDNFRLDYTQHFPVQGLAASLGGPASVAVNRSAAMTAVVAFDGAPLPGATVAFSVAGAGPATPSSATATTGSTGQAAFSFSASVEGDYVVTATATSSAYPGEERSATFTVFFSGPRPNLKLNGQPRAQNGDVVLAEADLDDDSDPINNGWPYDPLGNVAVNFSVSAPSGGQAVPAAGSAVTDSAGRAGFNFSATRAGTYTVTATATYAGQNVSDSYTVEFVVKAVSQVASLDLGSTASGAMVRDPAGTFAYLGTQSFSAFSAAKVRKIELSSLTLVGELTLSSANSEWSLTAGAVDPAGEFAYFGTGRCIAPSSCGSVPGRVVKVDLSTFQRVGALTLAADETYTYGATIDPAGDFAYFSAVGSKIVKVDLRTFERVGALTVPEMPSGGGFRMDPAGQYGYYHGETVVNGGGPALIVKIDLSTFQRVDQLQLDALETRRISSMAFDPAGRYAYYGSNSGNTPSHNWITKIDLITMQAVGASVPVPYVGYEDAPWFSGAFIDAAGKFAYFAADKWVIKIELATMAMTYIPLTIAAPHFSFALVDPQGEFAYYRTGGNPPYEVIKVDLTRTPKPALVAGDESYATPYVTALTVAAPGVLANDIDTEDADALVIYEATDPAGGSVAMAPDGSFTYTPDVGFFGTDTFTYQSTDGIDLSPPATVTVVVGAPPPGVQSVSGGACGYLTSVSLFSAPQDLKGCGQAEAAPATSTQVDSRSASVTLPATGSSGTLSATKPAGAIALYGPAALFSGIWTDDLSAPPPSGPQSVTSAGTTGSGGSVTSSAHVVLHDTPLPVRCDGEPAGTTNCTAPGGIGPGPLIAEEAHSTCTADESGLSGSASFVNGVVETKYDVNSQLPIVIEDIPADPAPNTVFEGTLDHVGDAFRVVLNEQILGPDSIVVNAAHMYLLGPTAVGELIVGQSRCGVDLAASEAAPVAADDAYTATSGVALSVPTAGVLANDTDTGPLRASVLAPLAPPASGGGGWAFPSDPAHGTLALGADGSFTYTAEAGYTGPDAFTYQAQDARGRSDTATVALTVVAPMAPVAADDAYVVTEDTPLTVAAPGVVANDTDAEGATLTATKVTDPAHGAVTLNPDGSFTYTPAADYTGPDSFTYTASDGSLDSNTATVSLTVAAVNDAPAAVADAATTTEDTPVTVAAPGLLSNDTDADGDALSAAKVTDPAHGSVTVNANGSFTYTPAAHYNGPDSFTYAASDGSATSNLVTVNLAVTAVNDAPVAVADAYTAAFNTALTIAVPGVLANDIDVEANALTAVSASPPAHGTVTLNPNGSFTYTPTTGYTGSDAFTYRSSDGTTTSGPATVSITVSAATGTLVSVGSVAVPEGDASTRPAIFTVSLSAPSASTVTVAYTTVSGNASAGGDYTAKSGTVSFAPGITTAKIKVPVLGDTAVEANETFSVILSGATAATVVNGTGTGTVVNDDAVTGRRLAIGDVRVHEGDAGIRRAVFTVSLSTASTTTVKVNYATLNASAAKPGDYTALSGTLTFAPGATSMTVAVTINPDDLTEGNETFTVNLTTPSGAVISDASGLGTIVNDD